MQKGISGRWNLQRLRKLKLPQKLNLRLIEKKAVLCFFSSSRTRNPNGGSYRLSGGKERKGEFLKPDLRRMRRWLLRLKHVLLQSSNKSVYPFCQFDSKFQVWYPQTYVSGTFYSRQCKRFFIWCFSGNGVFIWHIFGLEAEPCLGS